MWQSRTGRSRLDDDVVDVDGLLLALGARAVDVVAPMAVKCVVAVLVARVAVCSDRGGLEVDLPGTVVVCATDAAKRVAYANAAVRAQSHGRQHARQQQHESDVLANPIAVANGKAWQPGKALPSRCLHESSAHELGQRIEKKNAKKT